MKKLASEVMSFPSATKWYKKRKAPRNAAGFFYVLPVDGLLKNDHFSQEMPN